jgi:hypothetical protein
MLFSGVLLLFPGHRSLNVGRAENPGFLCLVFARVFTQPGPVAADTSDQVRPYRPLGFLESGHLNLL